MRAPGRAALVSCLAVALAGCRAPAPPAGRAAAQPPVVEPRGPLVDSLDLGFERDGDWHMDGGQLDGSTRRFGRRSARLRPGSRRMAVATQLLPVEQARGRRVQLCGWVKTSQVVDGYAGLWLRIDRGQEVVQLDNMRDRGLRGDNGWTRVEVVADVPVEATAIAFGGLVTGTGTAWIDGLDIEILDNPARSASIAGTVRGPNGLPAAGAIVAAVPSGATSAAAVVLADERGQFRAPVPAGEYAVTATSPGATAAYLPPARVAAGRSRTVDLRLAAAASGFELTGMAVDGAGQPLAGALVACMRYSEVDGDIFYARAGADGRYRIGLLRAHHSCSALRGEESSGRVEVTAGTARLDFRVEAPGPAPDAVIDWVRGAAIPLLSVQAGHGRDDMRPLRSLIGGARVVALGEATHGTREFFQLKHRLLEYLVAELGFTVFAIEASFPESEAVNDYVLTGQGDPARALAGLHFWTWDTEEVRDLIAWMREWNADPRHPRKLRFYGFDMQFSAEAAAALLRFVSDVDPPYAAALRPRLAAFSTTDYQENQKNIVAHAAALRAALADVRRRLDDQRAAYQGKGGKRAWLVARQSVRVLEQNVELNLDDRNALRIRDRAMADNLRWIAEVAEPRARVVAWAHNGHVANLERGGVIWMGAHLERELGKDYLPIGFSFHRGSFQAIDQSGRGRGLVEHTVGPAPVGSFDDTLQRAGWPIFALDLRRLPPTGPVADWFSTPRAMRETGSGFAGEEAMLLDRHLPGAFEAILFVESTTRARPNPTGRRPGR